MPIGKYIYCTQEGEVGRDVGRWVTNAYRQVHLLYDARVEDRALIQGSQMPIGKYIYCTIYLERTFYLQLDSHKCLSASTFTVPI